MNVAVAPDMRKVTAVAHLLYTAIFVATAGNIVIQGVVIVNMVVKNNYFE